MTDLQKAKLLLIRNGYKIVKPNDCVTESSDAYNYITEGVITDKIKNAIASIKNKFTKGDETDKAEAKEEIEDLKAEVQSSSISGVAKKALLASILGVMTMMGTANAGFCSISKYTGADGKVYTQQIGDCSEEDIQDLNDYKVKSKEKLAGVSQNKVSDKTVAKHIAAAFNHGDGYDGINVISQKTVDAEKRSEHKMFKFDDGTGIVVFANGYIIVYGKTAKDVLGEYNPSQSEAIYDMAKAMLKY